MIPIHPRMEHRRKEKQELSKARYSLFEIYCITLNLIYFSVVATKFSSLTNSVIYIFRADKREIVVFLFFGENWPLKGSAICLLKFLFRYILSYDNF